MPTILQDFQFEILPTLESDSGVVFGIGADISLNDGGFLPGAAEWLTQDSENPVRGSTGYGRDRLQGPTWSWELHTNGEDVSSGLASLARIKRAWRMEEIRDSPGEVLPVRYQLDNRVRRIYGRPRRFQESPANGILNGFVPISADFKCVDAYTYDDIEQSLQLGLAGGSQGGFRFPTRFPMSSLPVGEQGGQAVVGGDTYTFPVVEFDGPVQNPTLETNEWALTLDLTIGLGSSVVIDARPWKLTALLNGSSSVASALGRRQWLSDIKLSPGRHEFAFRGGSASGAATCTVRWANAWTSI